MLRLYRLRHYLQKYVSTSTLLEQIVYFTEKGASGDGRGVAGDPGPQVGALLGHGAGDGAPLHFPLVVHNHASVILQKIDM